MSLANSNTISTAMPEDLTLEEYAGKAIEDLNEIETEELRDWNFNILKTPETHGKFRFALAMFQDTNLFSFLEIDRNLFVKFLYNISLKYDHRSNPFHNFNHGITVAHGIYYMIKQQIATRYLDQVESFALLFSALCHDVDHTGHSNAFEVISASPLFDRYGKASPLERHHIAVTLKIVDSVGILAHLSQPDIQRVKKFITENILATDMTKHNEIMGNFRESLPKLLAVATATEENSAAVSSLTQEEKLNLSGALVHAADIGAPTRDFNISKEWSIRISKEFVSQVNLEKEQKYPVTTFYQGLDQYLLVAKNEIGFINFFIKPFWLEIQKFGSGLLDMVEPNIVKNVQAWQHEYETELERQESLITNATSMLSSN